MTRWLRVHLVAALLITPALAPAGLLASDAVTFRQAVEGGTVVELIVDAAERYGLDADRLIRIARCESGLGSNPAAYFPWRAHRGIYQFNRITWEEQAPLHDLPGDWWAAFDDATNVELAAALFAEGQAWRWTCR